MVCLLHDDMFTHTSGRSSESCSQNVSAKSYIIESRKHGGIFHYVSNIFTGRSSIDL